MIHITGTWKKGSYATDAPTADFDYTYTEKTGWTEKTDSSSHPEYLPPSERMLGLSSMVMAKDNVFGPPPHGRGHKPSFVDLPESGIFHTIEAYLNEFCETLKVDTDLFDENTGLDSLGGQIIY
jgi:hypothetical protein